MPECSEWVLRSKSVRLAMPSSSPHSLPGEAEPVLDVDGALRVVRQLLLRVLEVAQVVAGRCRGRCTSSVRSSIQYWCHSSSVPGSTKNSISICSNSRVRKMKLPGVISLRKRLADLADAERRLLARGLHDVGEVHEDALRGLGAQVVQAGLVLDRAEVGLQQPVEVARLGPLAAGAAVRAGDVGEAVLGRAALASPRSPPAGGRRGSACGSCRHSTSGSVKTSTWPEATQTWRGRMTEESRPTMSSRPLHDRAATTGA